MFGVRFGSFPRPSTLVPTLAQSGQLSTSGEERGRVGG